MYNIAITLTRPHTPAIVGFANPPNDPYETLEAAKAGRDRLQDYYTRLSQIVVYGEPDAGGYAETLVTDAILKLSTMKLSIVRS